MLKRIIRYKVYFDRSGQYINYFKTLIVIAMAYKLWEDDALGIWIYDNKFWFIPITILMYVVLRVVVGRYEKKLKVREMESVEYNKTDPVITGIQNDMKHIKQLLDDNFSLK